MIWLTPEKLAEIGVTTAMLRHNRDKWRFRETSARGRNGKPVRETLLESLPERFQQAYLRLHYAEIEIDDRSLTTNLGSPVQDVDAGDDAVELERDGERRLTEAMLRYEQGVVRDAFLAEA